MGKMREGYDEEWLADLLGRFQTLDCPGTVAYTTGTDLGLRNGCWTFAIVADFDDAEAYRTYDADARHNLLRDELATQLDQVARVQFRP
jgi:hypothetical protein